ncbi:MAG: sulfatase-like hydrolase/transferase [Burkholderiales bacterium]|nr:sulfatase-like hydrolase/transferase [Burkholderiales bacterium]
MGLPNIIFIVADDLGYADLGCYGGREPVSPRLDALAADGIRFTQGYSNSPVCSPTRFALMTAGYQYRLRGAAEEPIGPQTRGSEVVGLPPGIPTLPSRLRDAGYRTALVGKWHLGYPPAFGPLKSGYEAFYGSLSGGVDYFSHRDSSGTPDLWCDEACVEDDTYLTDLLSRRACEYVREHASEARSGRPFFLSLHYTAPHWPWESRSDREISFGICGNIFHHDGGNVATYLRMISHMDEGIGTIVDALRDEGLLDETLVSFTSDNGGERFSDSWPLVGGKLDLTEGGIRVPWIAHWPKVISPGRTSDLQFMTMDWSATILDAAGVLPSAGEASSVDGVSLLPHLMSAEHRGDPRPLFWRMKHRGQRAARLGSWKYLKVDDNEYLFDLSKDERERANLSARHPDRLELLRAMWLAWNETMPPIPQDAAVIAGFTQKHMPAR